MKPPEGGVSTCAISAHGQGLINQNGNRRVLWLQIDIHLVRFAGMTSRLKYLLIAVCISLVMWAGILSGVAWYAGDGTDNSFTASPR